MKNKNLTNASLEELKAEIERREKESNLLASIQPVAFSEKRYQEFVHSIKSIVEAQFNDDDDSDNEHWVYESALIFVYGQNIFDKLNKISR